jgi:hypothetical protein
MNVSTRSVIKCTHAAPGWYVGDDVAQRTINRWVKKGFKPVSIAGGDHVLCILFEEART